MSGVARQTTPAALETEELQFRYPEARSLALDGVNLTVGQGEFIVLAGGSGSGKTSLLRAGCGLIPHFHGGEISGSAVVAGRDVTRNGPGELADVVGYVAQDPETQIVSTTVAAELDLPLRFRGDQPASRARAVEEVALALGIPQLLSRTVVTLSGGEMQRVALAAALVTRPPLILLDEPTSQLDPVSGDELIWLLRRLNEEWGVAVVLAEHRLERCLAAADRVVAMDQGRIGFDGSPGDFLSWAVAEKPELATPSAAMFSGAGIRPLPTGVREARRLIRQRMPGEGHPDGGSDPGQEGDPGSISGQGGDPGSISGQHPVPDPPTEAVLQARRLWVELDPGEGPVDVLRGIGFQVAAGEKVALMGRNGAGKSTLLRSAAGLIDPAAGSIEATRGIALLTQSPADFLVRERIGDELPGPSGEQAMAAVGLDLPVDRDPRDLSGGERQRLALAITLAGRMEAESLPGVICLDEPTRGMDRGLKEHLVELTERLAGQGAAVVISTHDVEFAVSFADRVLLLGEGEIIADARMEEVLSGGWYFASEVARIIDRPGLVSVRQGIDWLQARDAEEGPS